MKLNLDITPVGQSEESVAEVFRIFPDDQKSEHIKVSGVLTVDNTENLVYIRGQLAVETSARCDRCLSDFDFSYLADVEITIVRIGDFEPSEDDPDSWTIHQQRGPVDLDEPLREASTLDMPSKAVCREDCLGFCPTCGTNRNESPCECTTTASDPRWDNLPT